MANIVKVAQPAAPAVVQVPVQPAREDGNPASPGTIQGVPFCTDGWQTVPCGDSVKVIQGTPVWEVHSHPMPRPSAAQFVIGGITGVTSVVVTLVAFIYFLRMIQAWMLHRTLRSAIQRDSASAELLIERIDRNDRSAEEPRSDDRNGLVLIALGVALAGCAVIVSDPEWIRYGLGAALFPVLVGLALLARHVWLRRLNKDA